MQENSSFQNLTDRDSMNNTLTASNTPYRPSVALVVFTTVAMVTLMLNVTCVVVCFKTLQNKFQNLVVLALSFSDTTMSLGSVIMVVSWFISDTGFITGICLVQLIMVFCGVLTTYSLIILLCLQRYFTVKSFNFGTNEHLNKKKFCYVGGTLLLPFVYTTAVTVLTPHKIHVDQCDSVEVYGDNYFFYTLLIASCLSFLVIVVLSITAMTGFRLWRTFFKQRIKIKPTTQDTNGNIAMSKADADVPVIKERSSPSKRFTLNYSRSNSLATRKVNCSSPETKQVQERGGMSLMTLQKRDGKSEYQLDGATNTATHHDHHGTNEERISRESISIVSTNMIETFVIESSDDDFKLDLQFASDNDDYFNRKFYVHARTSQKAHDKRIDDADNKHNKRKNDEAEKCKKDEAEKCKNDEADKCKNDEADKCKINEAVKCKNDLADKHKNSNDDKRKHDANDKCIDDAAVKKASITIIAWEDTLPIPNNDEVTSIKDCRQYPKKTTDGLRQGSDERTVESLENGIDKKNSVKQRLAWEARAFITCLLLAMSTIIFTCPMIVMLYIDMSGNLLSNRTKSFGFLPLLVNSFLNPFVYGWRIPEIKGEFKKLLRIPQ